MGSWIIAAPVSGSSHSRSDAASPGRASVPAGRGFTTLRRNTVCRACVRAAHRKVTGTHSMSFRPPTGVHARTAERSQMGVVQASSIPPPA